MKMRKKNMILSMAILLFVILGSTWYNQDLKFRIADVKLCENNISFLHQYKNLQIGCYKDSYSYGKYHNIRFSEVEQGGAEKFMDGRQNSSELDNEFEYDLDKYKIKAFVKNKMGDGSILLSESYGDLVYVKIYDDNDFVVSYRIVIALSNPGHYTTHHQSIYKKTKDEDIKKIINLIIKKI